MVYELDGSGATYTIRVTSVADAGTIRPNVAPGVCQGVSYGINEASDSTDNLVTYDPTLALADFSASPTDGETPLTVQLHDESIPGTLPILSWYWEFGDGETSTEQNPEHIYEAAHDYTVSLTVTTLTTSNTWTKESYIHVSVAMHGLGYSGLLIITSLIIFAAVLYISRKDRERLTS